MVKVFFPSESFHVKINYEARCARTGKKTIAYTPTLQMLVSFPIDMNFS